MEENVRAETKSPRLVKIEKVLYRPSKKRKEKVIPFYLKSQLPDQRFLEFRLFIRNRKVNEVQHDLKYFDSMFPIRYSKKKSKSVSVYTRNSTFDKKKQEYIKKFTNGSVDIGETNIAHPVDSLRQNFEGLKPRDNHRLNHFIDKALQKKKKRLERNSNRPNTGVANGLHSKETFSYNTFYNR